MLQLRQVSRRYGARWALEPIDLSVVAGSCVALLGVNGSGKSTLLRIAAGLDRPTEGEACLDGRPVNEDDPAVRAKVAVVGDATAFYPDLTVREHLEFVARGHGLRAAAGEVVEDTLAALRLHDRAAELPVTLSAGERQLLALAAALVRPRTLLVLDEPEQRLDPGARARLADILAAERAAGRGTLLATHHVELAAAVADTVVVLEAGRVLRRGSAEILAG